MNTENQQNNFMPVSLDLRNFDPLVSISVPLKSEFIKQQVDSYFYISTDAIKSHGY